MTEAGWTREKPTAHGWYFYKDKDGFIDVVAVRRVDSYGGPNLHEVVITVEKTTAVYQKNLHSKVSDLDGEWLGPITLTDRQQGQVEAFKQGIEKIREREKFYTEQEAISEGQMRMTRGLQRNESSCCIHELEKLAQAAQEGRKST